ncbi:MAG: 16S rRNA (cytosine(1402)-N(4))-methyltransferase, partial [Planctomycetales bacterium]|nr:16S rRNA (cytosine(1402)-N(4))-methyltransferase [Planctomycetales bacterium]
MSVSPSIHVSVMPEETLEWLDARAGHTMLDGTLGGGGHTRLLAERVGAAGRIVSVDQDPVAIERARQELASLPVTLVQANFCELEHIAAEAGVEKFDGALLDLGLTSDQLADRERGFSYEADGELDLR